MSENLQKDRSSRPEVFCEKAVLRNVTKFTGKHLCQSLFFNEVAGRPESCEISQDIIFTEHLWATVSRTGNFKNFNFVKGNT